MSNICIGLIRATQDDQQFLKERLYQKINEMKLGVAFNIDWDEPILDRCDKDMFIFSICDSGISTGCEMLLLPDGWFNNGKTNPIPFADRMHSLQVIAEVVLKMGYSIEFYIGASGTLKEEYFECSVPLYHVGEFIASSLYSYTDYVSNPLHIMVG